MADGRRWWPAADGPWWMACGGWPAADGLRPMADGPRPMADGPRPMVPPRPLCPGLFPTQGLTAYSPQPLFVANGTLARDGLWPSAYGLRPGPRMQSAMRRLLPWALRDRLWPFGAKPKKSWAVAGRGDHEELLVGHARV